MENTSAGTPDQSDEIVDVAIVGGGPVGMLMAAELTLQGLTVVLFEPRTEVDRRPRAGTVHARSLSHLARRGYVTSVAPEEIERRSGTVRRAEFQFAGSAGLTLSAPAQEPSPLAGIPQAQLEATFAQRALSQGADTVLHRGRWRAQSCRQDGELPGGRDPRDDERHLGARLQ
ncbi:MAG: FAD-dependent monooxygenase [Brevibacterium sp.]|nr:FAD-dependent monooxygenase [Brevibacterium sp.]